MRGVCPAQKGEVKKNLPAGNCGQKSGAATGGAEIIQKSKSGGHIFAISAGCDPRVFLELVDKVGLAVIADKRGYLQYCKIRVGQKPAGMLHLDA